MLFYLGLKALSKCIDKDSLEAINQQMNLLPIQAAMSTLIPSANQRSGRDSN